MYRVALIDDDEWILKGIEHTFPWDKYGFSPVAKFTEPKDLLDFLSKNSVDVIFTDIKMMGMTGLELIEKVKKDLGLSDMLFVIISAYDDYDFMREAIKLGVVDYCRKPILRSAAEKIMQDLSEKLTARQNNKNEVLNEQNNKNALPAHDGLQKIIDYINKNLERRLTLSDIANYSGYNSSAVMAAQKLGDIDWLKSIFPKLKLHIKHWEDTQLTDKGLFVWRSMRGGGTDNHPALYGRPLNSAAGSDLNSYFCMEYLAMAKIASLSGNAEDEKIYRRKSEKLADAVNENMYDPIDGMYYYLDMLSQKPPTATAPVNWNVPLKFKMWTGFAPLYAKIAPENYAKRAIEEHLLNPNEFWSDYGLRSMAKNEPIYNTVESSNPSNWQGPIWVVSTYIMYKSLLNYGYEKEAKKCVQNLVNTLYYDYENFGAFHEYWNPETGKSNIKLGFMNWNALIGIMD